MYLLRSVQCGEAADAVVLKASNTPTGLLRFAGVALLLWLGMACHGWAQPHTAASGEAYAEQFELWDNTLQGINQRLSESRITRAEIPPLSDQLRVLQEQIAAQRDHAATRVNTELGLLDALGPAPEEGQIAESKAVAAERKAIRENLSQFQSQQKQSELLLARLNNILEQMVDAQYATLFELLSTRTVFPLALHTLAEARLQLGERLGRIGSLVRGWWHSATGLRPFPIACLLLLLAVGTLTQRTLRGWRRDRQGRLTHVKTPNRGQRFMMAIIYIGEHGVIPAVTLAGMAAVLHWQSIAGTQFHLKASELMRVAARLIFMLGVVTAVLAPRYPRWRISGFTDDAALGLYRAVRLYVLVAISVATTIVMLHPSVDVTGNVSEEALASYFRIYPELSSISGMLILMVAVATLLNILRPRHWRFVRKRPDTRAEIDSLETDDDDDDDDRFRGHRTVEQTNNPDSNVAEGGTASSDTRGRPPSLLPRIGLMIGRIALVMSLVAGAVGFLNAGVYITDRMASTVGLIGLALMLRKLIATGLHYAMAADSRFGIHLRKSLVLDDAGSSRLVFWLLLIIDTVLIVTGIVVISLLWGLPVAELQLFSNLVLYGFAIGDLTLSLKDAVTAIVVFLLVLTVVRILRGVLSAKILTQTRLDIGARDAVTTIVGYLGLTVAALVALTVLGLDLSRLALILGALSVGIGFGLQHVVSNFVSGLILLATRPIKSGDWIVVGQYQGYVKHISVVTTEIQTFDNAAVLVPNSSLVSNDVLNWTHKSTVGRVIVAVRASYDTSPEQVRKVLRRCVRANSDVLRRPAPQVLFMGFGASSLDFEIRFFIREIDNVLLISSDLRYQIIEAFQEEGISIPFPQQDVHLRDVRTTEEHGATRLSENASGEPVTTRTLTAAESREAGLEYARAVRSERKE